MRHVDSRRSVYHSIDNTAMSGEIPAILGSSKILASSQAAHKGIKLHQQREGSRGRQIRAPEAISSTLLSLNSSHMDPHCAPETFLLFSDMHIFWPFCSYMWQLLSGIIEQSQPLIDPKSYVGTVPVQDLHLSLDTQH